MKSIDRKPGVFILSTDDQLQQHLRDRLANFPHIDTTCLNSVSQFWDALLSSTCDLLFLDDRILQSDNKALLTGLCNLSAPIIIVASNGERSVCPLPSNNRILATLSGREISTLDISFLLQQADLRRQHPQVPVDLSSIDIPIMIWDFSGILRQVSKGMDRLLGFSLRDLIGQHIDTGFFALFQPALTFRKSLCCTREVNLCFAGPSGHPRYFAFQFSEMPMIPAYQTTMGYVAIGREVTEELRIQNEQQEERLFNERILKTTPNIVFVWDINQRKISYINQAVEESLGYSPEDMIAMKPDDWESSQIFDNKSDVLNHLNSFAQIKEQEVVEYEYHLRDRKNAWHWFRSRETIFTKELDGAVRFILGSMEDITNIKQIQDRLEKRLRREELFASLTMGFLNMDPKLYSSQINEAMNRIRRLTECDALIIYEAAGSTLTKTHETTSSGNPTHLPRRISIENNPHFSEYLRLKKPLLIEPGMEVEPHIRHYFSKIFGEKMTMVAIFPLTFQDAILGAVLFSPPSSQAHWTSFEISIAHTFASILSNVIHNVKTDYALSVGSVYRWGQDPGVEKMICQFGRNHIITYANDLMSGLFGVTKQQMIGKSFDSFLPPTEQQYITAMLSSMSKDKLVLNIDRVFVCPDGKMHKLEWVFRGFLDENDEIREYQIIGRDITHIKKIQDDITTEQANQVQNARLRSIGELATGVAHQISNPLTTIIAEAQLLTQELLPNHPARESVDAIVEAGWQAQDVIQILKQISEINNEKNELISVNDTIASALSLTSEYLESANVGIFTELQADLSNISGNSRDLMDCWMNFLLLAHSAARNSQLNQVEIFTHNLSPEWIEIVFQNNGRIFSDDNQETLYEPRAVSDPTKLTHGFELMICREIINRHQGELTLESAELSTTFRVHLPKG